ncbi:hypothetical protein FISHEDRAFT_37365 [Fistulina hepatica ATCC 64428]|uniref:Uncharacterized protein n=1 Tax=Fistulina hepatica ATCC 64428 TaxID=1128425 RepID=A0A0D7AHW1_9AGAR|nr:hypothetical protein FISHEDRAFT_37365 [Fistulina hepatica ATCC 64428]
MRLRGEVCVGFGSLLSFAAVLLMIFCHVGQISTSNVPRHIYMAKVNATDYGAALTHALLDPIDGLYATNASAPLGKQKGLRDIYQWGLYSYCAYLDIRSNDTQGVCGNQTIGNQFRPYNALTGDMLSNYSAITYYIMYGTTFYDSKYLGQSTKAAYWMLLLGTITAALAFLTGFAKRSYLFFFSTGMSVVAAILLLVAATIWTVMIKKAGAIDDFVIGESSKATSLGITVHPGIGLYLLWASFALMFASIMPYMLVCCTYRG